MRQWQTIILSSQKKCMDVFMQFLGIKPKDSFSFFCPLDFSVGNLSLLSQHCDIDWFTPLWTLPLLCSKSEQLLLLFWPAAYRVLEKGFTLCKKMSGRIFFSCWCSFIGLLLPSVRGKTELWKWLTNFLPFPKYLFIQPFLYPAVQEFWNMQNVKKMNLEILDNPCQCAGVLRICWKGPRTRRKHIQVLPTHRDCGNSMAWNGVFKWWVSLKDHTTRTQKYWTDTKWCGHVEMLQNVYWWDIPVLWQTQERSIKCNDAICLW